MIREIFGYGAWIGMLVLVIMSVYIWIEYGKKSWMWKLASIVFFLFAVAVAIMQYIDAVKEMVK